MSLAIDDASHVVRNCATSVFSASDRSREPRAGAGVGSFVSGGSGVTGGRPGPSPGVAGSPFGAGTGVAGIDVFVDGCGMGVCVGWLGCWATTGGVLPLLV